jgi:hypothetical protein
MQHKSPIPYEDRRRVEAAVLALVLAEDFPWRADELAERLRLHADLIRLAAATLRADGLLISAPTCSRGSGEGLRASWAAVRGDELAGWGDSIKRRACMRGRGGAIPLH